MNAQEIVNLIIEANYEDEFDPVDFVKTAGNRESAVEIYNGPLVRVIQPTAAYTLNHYLPDNAEWDNKVFQQITGAGPIYLAVDKASHDNMVIFQPSTGKVWNEDGREGVWKDMAQMIGARGDDGKNWLDLQQGLATYFMAQIAKKKNVGQWVKYLTMIGRTDLATNYARYLGRAKLPLGKSIDAVLSMKKAGKRSRNRIARLMKSQQNVKWGEQGFWLLFDDWTDLADFYGESRDYDYAKNAKAIFGGDTHDWFDNAESDPEEAFGSINDTNMGYIRQLLANRTVYNSDGDQYLITQEMIEELTDDELKDIIFDRGNKHDATEDITNAIRWAANDAYSSSQEAAYYDGYRQALMKQWGLREDDTIKWIKVGKKPKDPTKESQKTMLGIWFPYSTLDEWITQWKEDEYEDDFFGDIHELAAKYLEKVEPNDEYWGDSDDDYFNEQLDYQLNELKLTEPDRSDPNQPELPMTGEPAPKQRSLEQTYAVHVGEPPNEKIHKGVDKSEATKYREAMKPTRNDITFRAEAFLAEPANYLEERAGDVRIEFEASKDAAASLVPLLKELRQMGNQGSSRDIEIQDWDGRTNFGFDGDGNAKIGEIKVDGALQESQRQFLAEALYKRSTTQIDIPEEIGQHIISWGELNIAEEDLYLEEDGGCGRETEQHVTVLYGLTDPTPPEALTHIVESTKPFLIEFAGVSIFQNEKYDVIKLDVVSEELTNLHMEIRRSCPNENKFPTYIPHCTIAYVKPGLGKKYQGQDVFKAATVPRDFWAYDLLFKGAGDSEDGNRVVQLISFDKSKDFEVEEPEAGEQRYPEATRDEEEPDLAMAESIEDGSAPVAGHVGLEPVPEDELKALIQRNVPVACPECHSANLSSPDEEGLVDCFDCGIWFDPFHPENRPVRENEEGDVDPKKLASRVTVDPHPDWIAIDRAEDKNGRVKMLYRHKNGRVFFKLLNDFFGDDTPPTPLTDWSVYVYGGADGKDFMDGEDFQANDFSEAETTATNIAFTIVHSTAPSYFQPQRPRRGRQQENEEEPIFTESVEINAKEFLNPSTNYRIRQGAGAETGYLQHDAGTGAFAWVSYDDATVFDASKVGEVVDWLESKFGIAAVAELDDEQMLHSHMESEEEVDPKALAMSVPTRYILRYKLSKSPKYLVASDGKSSRLGSSEFDNIRVTSNPAKATVFNMHDTTRWCQAFNDNYEPVPVQESLGPFDDDGLPGEVTTFLRKVRSKRRGKHGQPQPAMI